MNVRFETMSAVAVVAVLACACSGKRTTTILNDSPASEDGTPSNEAPVGIAEASVDSSPVEVSDSLKDLLVSMDSAGEGAPDIFERRWAAFVERPDALAMLATAYRESEAEHAGLRWKLVYAAGKLQSVQAAEFLGAVAIEPEGNIEQPLGEDHVRRDPGYTTRLAAAVGVSRLYLSQVAGSSPVLDRVLAGATPSIAQLAALELFGEGKLNDVHKDVLDARNIFYKFRRLSEEEAVALRTLTEEDLTPAPGKPANPKARIRTSVPTVETVQGVVK